jgi:hypothetical protein
MLSNSNPWAETKDFFLDSEGASAYNIALSCWDKSERPDFLRIYDHQGFLKRRS